MERGAGREAEIGKERKADAPPRRADSGGPDVRDQRSDVRRQMSDVRCQLGRSGTPLRARFQLVELPGRRVGSTEPEANAQRSTESRGEEGSEAWSALLRNLIARRSWSWQHGRE